MTLQSHWRVAKLEDCCQRPEYGFTGSASDDPVGPRLLRITDIQDGTVNWDSVPYVKITEGQVERYRLSPGDLVVARIGATTGKAFLLRDCPIAVFASYLIRLRPKPGFLPEFLNLCFQTPDYRRHIDQSKGGRLKGGISIPVLQGFAIPLPPLPEQRAIARALRAVQEAKEARQRELTLEGERKAALMEFLFTHGTRGETSEETDVGQLPRAWTLTPITTACEQIIDYRGKTPQFASEGVIHLRSSNIRFGRILLDGVAHVSEETYASFMTRGFPSPGDVIFTTEGPLGEAALVPPNLRFSLAQRLIVLHVNPSITSSLFLMYALYSDPVRRQYLGRATGSTVKGVSSKSFQKVKVPLPPLKEQLQIAGLLCACDSRLIALEREIEILHELFGAMLEELMTGRLPASPLIEQEAAS